MGVLTSGTCWALIKEIIKQVTSSWSLLTQRYINICHLPQGYARISICHKNKLKHLHSGVLVCLCDYEFVAATFRARCLFLTIGIGKNTTYSPDIVRVDQFTLLLGAFTKLREATMTFVMSVRPFVCPHWTARLPLDEFSWNFACVYFSKICREKSNFLKIRQE